MLQCRTKNATDRQVKNGIDWSTIALRYLPGRTVTHLSRRWQRILQRPHCHDGNLEPLLQIYRNLYVPLTAVKHGDTKKTSKIASQRFGDDSKQTAVVSSSSSSTTMIVEPKAKKPRGGARIARERLGMNELQRLADLVEREGPQWGAIARSKTIFHGYPTYYLRSGDIHTHTTIGEHFTHICAVFDYANNRVSTMGEDASHE